MKNYKLLTPGPLTTTDTVKQEMIFDHCTWDDDYKKITQKIQSELLDLAHADKEKYACVLMQGSGTFGVESVLSSVIKDSDNFSLLPTVHTAREWQILQNTIKSTTLCTLKTITKFQTAKR